MILLMICIFTCTRCLRLVGTEHSQVTGLIYTAKFPTDLELESIAVILLSYIPFQHPRLRPESFKYSAVFLAKLQEKTFLLVQRLLRGVLVINWCLRGC